MLKKYFYVLAALLLVLSSSVVFAQGNAGGASDAILNNKTTETFSETGTLSPTFLINYPNQVWRYRFSCTGGSPYSYYAIIGIGDSGIAGDYFKATIKTYERAPATTVLTGTPNLAGYNYALVYNWLKDPLLGEIEVRYDHGIDDFGALGRLYISCPGTLTLWTFPLSEF